MSVILGIVFAALAIALHVAADKAHRAEHGVGLPSRNARKRYRRRARDRGISEGEAHAQWVSNKHRWQGTAPPGSAGTRNGDSAGPALNPAARDEAYFEAARMRMDERRGAEARELRETEAALSVAAMEKYRRRQKLALFVVGLLFVGVMVWRNAALP